MGCDIHFYVEKRVDHVWISADTWYDDPDEGKSTTDWANYDWGDSSKNLRLGRPFYEGRHYDLFSILADVRNGYGFAGVETGRGFVPISAPRGIPEDACPEVRAASDAYGIDGHSHSFHTVADLLAYDWTRVTTKTGIVGLRDLARWKINGEPESWSGSIGGAGIQEFDGAEAVPMIYEILEKLPPYASGRSADWYTLYHADEGIMYEMDATQTDPNVVAVWSALAERLGAKRPVFRVNWETPYYHTARHFLSETLPRLWRLGAPEDVRIVFWFDN